LVNIEVKLFNLWTFLNKLKRILYTLGIKKCNKFILMFTLSWALGPQNRVGN